jgi:hypothetical protein
MVDSNAFEQVVAFLDRVVTTPEGFFCLSLMQPDGKAWTDQYFIWPRDRENIAKFALEKADKYNVYFSSYLYKTQKRTKDNVLPSRTIQADLDEADISDIPIKPNVIVQTSPGRSQAFWVLKQELDLDTHETLSKKITYAIKKADHSGWPVGRTARLPYTTNHKYMDGPKPVSVVAKASDDTDPISFELLATVDNTHAEEDDEWVSSSNKKKPTIGPHEILDELRKDSKLPAKIMLQYDTAQTDRSGALWALMLTMFRAGCDRDTVYWVARDSANNKFRSLRYGGDRELSKDVVRAEDTAKRKVSDVRSVIREIRRASGPKYLMHSALASSVLEVLQDEGNFIHTTDNSLWYVRRDTGKPISITRHSEYFIALLDVQFGLNRSEIEQTYVKDSLMAHAINIPGDTMIANISYYHPDRNELMVYTGLRDVITVSPTAITRAPNGSSNILFPWNTANEYFIPDYTPLPDGRTWYDILFQGAFDNVVDMRPEEAESLMRVWMMFILFRTASLTRPILAYLGQPGSGKSTAMRRLYRLLYGRTKDLIKANQEEHLNIASASDPFIVIDNLDTYQNWIQDWLSTTISNMDVTKRKLYSDGDKYTLKRQAIIGLTAHNPKFGREDIADRLLLITFRRLQHFGQEGEILDNITRNRNKLWGALLLDAQKVLREPVTTHYDAPQLRIADFAIVGLRIARALGCETDYVSAIQAVSQEQKLFTLEEDSMLVSALKKMVDSDKAHNKVGVKRAASELWAELEAHSGNFTTFSRIYGNSTRLSKKLQAMEPSLQEVFDIEYRYHVTEGMKMWVFTLKEEL